MSGLTKDIILKQEEEKKRFITMQKSFCFLTLTWPPSSIAQTPFPDLPLPSLMAVRIQMFITH